MVMSNFLAFRNSCCSATIAIVVTTCIVWSHRCPNRPKDRGAATSVWSFSTGNNPRERVTVPPFSLPAFLLTVLHSRPHFSLRKVSIFILMCSFCCTKTRVYFLIRPSVRIISLSSHFPFPLNLYVKCRSSFLLTSALLKITCLTLKKRNWNNFSGCFPSIFRFAEPAVMAEAKKRERIQSCRPWISLVSAPALPRRAPIFMKRHASPFRFPLLFLVLCLVQVSCSWIAQKRKGNGQGQFYLAQPFGPHLALAQQPAALALPVRRKCKKGTRLGI